MPGNASQYPGDGGRQLLDACAVDIERITADGGIVVVHGGRPGDGGGPGSATGCLQNGQIAHQSALQLPHLLRNLANIHMRCFPSWT